MRKLMNVVLSGLMAITMVAGVAAQDVPNTEVQVTENTSGVLDVSIESANFGAYEYSLTDQTVTSNIVVVATDPRGNNAGWNVTVQGLDFTSSTTNTPIGIENLRISSSANVVPGPGSTTGITTPGGVVAEAPASTKILSAAEGSGTGKYTVTFQGSELTIPGGTLVGTYTTTLTVTISTGP